MGEPTCSPPGDRRGVRPSSSPRAAGGAYAAAQRAYAGRAPLPLCRPKGEPLHVVMIDELAALTAYWSDRELQRRSEKAINLLCSQGRAAGFMVVACLQDPRKEVIPSRGLFTQMVGLRLKDLSETSMVLGEVAVESGAHCHRITRDVPGTGFVVPEDGGPPLKVRAGYASDEAIRWHGYASSLPCAPPDSARASATAARSERRSTRRPHDRQDHALCLSSRACLGSLNRGSAAPALSVRCKSCARLPCPDQCEAYVENRTWSLRASGLERTGLPSSPSARTVPHDSPRDLHRRPTPRGPGATGSASDRSCTRCSTR